MSEEKIEFLSTGLDRFNSELERMCKNINELEDQYKKINKFLLQQREIFRK